MNMRLFTVGLIAAAITLSACDSTNIDVNADEVTNPPAMVSLGGAAALGVVTNADVNFYRADGATLIGSGTTGADGSVSVTVTTGYSGPVVVEVLGDDVDAMYFDEAAGMMLPFPAGNSLRAIVPAPGTTIAVTTLTELAYQAALNDGLFPLSASEVNATNNAIRMALAPGLSSITSLPTPVDATTGAGDLGDTEAGRYALYLAALANVASGDAAPALAMLNALVADAADGALDASVAGAPYSDFIAEMGAALTAAANNYANAQLQSNAGQLAPTSTQVSSGGGGGGQTGPNGTTAPGTVNSGLVSQYTLTAIENQPGSPYGNGDMVMVIVTDTTLQIDGGAVLTDPFVREINGSPNSSEIIWLDASANIEYALSDNASGTFNEINIGDASNPISQGIPGFLGQLVDQSTGGGEGPAGIELVTALAGSYTVDSVIDGSHTRGTVVIDENGRVDYDDGIAYGPGDYEAVFDRLDCCMRVGIQMQVQGDGKQPTIDLYVDADGNLERVRFLTDGLDSPGSEVAVSSGTASTDPQDGNAGMAKVTGNGATGVIGGTEYTYVGDVLDSSTGDRIQLDFINPQSAVQRWRLFAPKQVGISACSDAGDNTLLQFIDGSNPRDTEDCMIKVVQAGPIYEGYFTGTVLASDGVTLEQITDGYFYYDPTPTGSGASLPAGTNGAAIRVTQGGGSYMTGDSYVPTTVQNGYSRPGQHFANFSGDGITFFQMNGLPETTGTYACGENPNGEFQTVSMMFEFTYRNSYGSSVCEITINMAGNTYEGSFTATLFNQEATESVSIEGEFRFPAPQ